MAIVTLVPTTTLPAGTYDTQNSPTVVPVNATLCTIYAEMTKQVYESTANGIEAVLYQRVDGVWQEEQRLTWVGGPVVTKDGRVNPPPGFTIIEERLQAGREFYLQAIIRDPIRLAVKQETLP